MTDAKNKLFDDLPPGDCAAAEMVDRGYLVGNRIGISGTPALFKSNGKKIEGYRPYQELIPQILQ
jgi:protein-disulfide isomerase